MTRKSDAQIKEEIEQDIKDKTAHWKSSFLWADDVDEVI